MADDIHEQILKSVTALSKKQTIWRRHLHQYPELSNQEFQTTAYLNELLHGLSIKTKKITLPTGILAEIKGTENGPVVAVRTDIDALPILEQTDLSFKSKNIGCMHACGHDIHMTVLLGVAAVLHEHKDKLAGSVRFIFQPAEEMPPGGAVPMIENGALKDVKMIFGLHVDPHLAVGKIGLRDGVTMAAVTDFDLIIRGTGGHAARPQNAVDAIVTAAEIVNSLQKIISREVDPIEPVVITFGKMNGGTARNVISDEVRLEGTVRTLSAKTASFVPKRIKQVVDAICKGQRAKAEMNIIATYPVLANDKKVNTILRQSFETLYGRGKIEETPQVLGGEDFACYLSQTAGAMFRLGTMNKSIAADKSWHSPHFKVDEKAIPVGTATLALAVINTLRK